MKRGKRQPHNDQIRLLLRAGRGDTSAFEQLYVNLFPAVRDYLASLNGSMDYHRREDLAQEVFLRTWQAASRFEGNSSAKTYIFAIARNVFLKERFQRQRLRIVHVGEMDNLAGTYVSDEPVALRQDDPDDLPHAVRQEMAKLPQMQRQAVELDQICELPRAKAVELARCNPAQFTERLYRARKRLKRLLKNLPLCIL